MSAPEDGHWLARAIELATVNVADGGGPFGAVVVRYGHVVAEGQNRVTADLDPTAHAEVVAIRAACRARGGFDDREFYELFSRDRDTWHIVIDTVRPANARAPFDAWLAHEHRTDY